MTETVSTWTVRGRVGPRTPLFGAVQRAVEGNTNTARTDWASEIEARGDGSDKRQTYELPDGNTNTVCAERWFFRTDLKPTGKLPIRSIPHESFSGNIITVSAERVPELMPTWKLPALSRPTCF